jgi:hypothetical protein
MGATLTAKELKQVHSTVKRVKLDVESLYEELDILMDRTLSRKVHEGLKQAKKGELHGWEEFQRALRE